LTLLGDAPLQEGVNVWPPSFSTRERLAFALLLYTGQRCGDVYPTTRGSADTFCRIVRGFT
jgi:hypothetical protein